MKIWKRFLSLGLVTIITAMMFVGCGSSDISEGVAKNDYPITIRTMQDGDSIMTSSGPKKLSRLFINAKIPALKRKTWPVVLNKDKTIILVPHIAKNIDYLTTKPNVFVIK